MLIIRFCLELGGNSSQETAAGLSEVAIEVLHFLLSYLLQIPKEDNTLTEDQLQSFFTSLRKDFPQERVPTVLAPLLYPVKQQEEVLILDYDTGTPLKVAVSETIDLFSIHALINGMYTSTLTLIDGMYNSTLALIDGMYTSI